VLFPSQLGGRYGDLVLAEERVEESSMPRSKYPLRTRSPPRGVGGKLFPAAVDAEKTDDEAVDEAEGGRGGGVMVLLELRLKPA